MHSRLALALFLLTCAAACGGDSSTPAERPADRSVEPWGSCVWEWSVTPSLCADDTICTDYGVCHPTCARVEDCAEFGGDVCEPIVSAALMPASACFFVCDAMTACPDAGGAPLRCAGWKRCVGE